MTDFLPPVIAKLEGDISDYLAKLGAADEAMKRFGKGIPEGLSRQRGPIGDEGSKAGEAYAGKFSDTITKQLDKALKDLPDVKVNADSSEADVKLAALRHELESLRDEKVGVTIDDRLVAAQLARIRAEMDALTKDAKIPLKFDLKESSAALGEAEKFIADTARELGDSGGQQAGGNFLTNFFGKLEAPEGGGMGGAIAGLVAGLVATGPAWGSAIGGAIVLGIASVGIGAGIAAEISNPAVHSALTTLKGDLKATFAEAAAPFAPEIEAAAAKFDGFMTSIEPRLHDLFAALAPLLQPLEKAAEVFVDKLLPGFQNAAKGAAPLFEELVWGANQLGSAISRFMTDISSDSEGARIGIRMLVEGLSMAIDMFGGLLSAAEHVLSGVSNFLVDATDDVVTFLQGIVRLIPGMGAVSHALDDLKAKTANMRDNINHFGDSSLTASGDLFQLGNGANSASLNFATLSSQIKNVTQSADTLAGDMTDKVLNSLLGVANAELGVHTALTAVSTSLKQNGRNFDENTAKGQANMQALLADVAANQRLYDQNIASGMSATEAAAKYDQNTAALERQLRKAGLTQAQIDNLIGAYAKVPDQVNTSIAVNGLTQAINDLDDLLRKLLGLPPRKTISINVNTYYKSYGGGPNKMSAGQYGLIQQFDAGGLFNGALPAGTAGIVEGGGPYAMFGEPGTGAQTEGFLPRSGIPVSRAAALLSTMAGWYGMSVVGGPATVSSGGPGGTTSFVPININLGGTQMASLLAALIPAAQQQKIRTGTTGLT